MGRINTSYGPRSSNHLAWRLRWRGSRGLRSGKGLSRTQEDRGRRPGHINHTSHIHRHLHYEDGAGIGGPSHGSTCRGGTCPVPCARASTSSNSRSRTLRSVRDRPASTRSRNLLGAFVSPNGGTHVGKEAYTDIQEEDRSGKERNRREETGAEAQEALSERQKTRAWVHKPTLHIF